MEKVKLMTVCHGNICRSAMAKVLLDDAVQKLGKTDLIEVDSSGISSEEQGNPMDYRAVETLKLHGFDISTPNISSHRAKKITQQDIKTSTLILPMTYHQYDELTRWLRVDKEKVYMWRFFDDDAEMSSDYDRKLHTAKDLEDPWYGNMDNFEITYQQLINNTEKIVEFALTHLLEK